jgi:hypothetical protein
MGSRLSPLCALFKKGETNTYSKNSRLDECSHGMSCAIAQPDICDGAKRDAGCRLKLAFDGRSA